MSWFCGDNSCERPDCSYDLWAPNHRNKVVNTAFSAYAFHQQQVEDFINALAAVADPNDYEVQRYVARDVGIRIDDLSDGEINYIEREVAKRWSSST